LRLSEECFSKAFNASPVLMAITTLAEGKYIKANHAFCRALGYAKEEIIGKSSFELGFCSDPGERYLVEQKIIANQPVKDMEIRFSKKNGEQRWGLFSAERLDVNGESCLLCIVTDVTELRQMEFEMNRLDRLNVVGEMAASIGHEIRNPMTTVRGYLQLLQANKNYNKEVGYFNLMIEELDRANSIITEFLSLAKDKMLDMKLQNLNSIIEKSLPLLQVKAMSRDQIIKLDLHDLPDLLLDDKEIRQLILNLVNNGIESMYLPGKITIRTYIKEDNVLLAVKDEGHGIDHKLLDKLGTPFFTTKEQGTGLGLAVCYRIASRHKAQIDLETSSTGTTFFVKFPIPKIQSAAN
jgi:PAS domain S-box-containing protein